MSETTLTGLAPDHPIERFAAVMAEARRIPPEVLPEPTAFTLATIGDDGRPSARVVLLKAVDERGFVFYTNYESRKGRELLQSRWAALCFHWQALETQIRVEGPVASVSDAEADEYFASRPRASQIGAWASIQSRPMEHDTDLDTRIAETEKRFAGGPVPRPPHWSGFRVSPEHIEFWKNMPSRLHLRHLYTRKGDGWSVQRLYP